MTDATGEHAADVAARALAGAEVVAFPRPAAGGSGDDSGAANSMRGGNGRARADGGGDSGGDRGRTRHGLPAGCPVTPLGTHDGVYFYLDAVGQLRGLKARDHGNKDLLSLFAPRTDFVHTQWPRLNAKGITTGWRPEEAAEELMVACSRAGVWNARDKVRGRGAWLDAAGGLILHVGDAVLMGGEWRETGLHAGHVYPSAPAIPRPQQGAASADMMEELLATIKTWNWVRGEVDPYLLLGWLAAARLGGALKWRPLVWVTGDKGTGKSTFHDLIHGLMGDGMLGSSDASEAGIRQTLGDQTLPVAIDEAEADDDNRKLMALVKLARQAASGGNVVRGGADHNAHAFTARACFLLSSILLPPLKGQDRSRLAILSLEPLPPGQKAPPLTVEWLQRMGAAMTRRLVDGWARWGETVDVYRTALMEAGHVQRAADQFGVLLAAADLLLADTVPTADDVAGWKMLLSPAALSETSGDVSDAARCLDHLLTSSVTLDGGGRPQTVAHWVGAAVEDLECEDPLGKSERASKGLAVYGLRVVERRDGTRWLAVAMAHQGLARLYRESHWQAASGANGVWAQALRRLAGAEDNVNVRIDGKGQKCVLVPIALVRDEGDEAAV